MLRTPWRKSLRDLSRNRGRTISAIMAITVGVAAVGSILTGYSIITREIDRNYQDTIPPSAILYLDTVDADLIESVVARPEVTATEGRREVTARLLTGADEWVPLQLVVVADFDDLDVARFYPESGRWGPATDEIAIERSSLDEVPLSVGDNLNVVLPLGPQKEILVAGLVHDPGRSPAWMTGHVIGYVTPAGPARLGGESSLNQLLIVTEQPEDRLANRQITDSIRAGLEAAGVEVARTVVPAPGEHPAQSIVTTMLFLRQAFGAVAMLASSALVATLITAQLKQQSREIGVMKAVGAQTSQISGIYLFSVSLLATTYPIIKNSRLPVREVIVGQGISPVSTGSGGRLSGLTRHLDRPTAMGIRNAFRSRSRTTLTVLALSLGGAAFMVALNSGVAWDRAVETEFEARSYQLEVNLDGQYPADRITQSLQEISQTTAAETWNQFPAAIELPEGGVGDTFRLLIPPPTTRMIDYPLIEGRWLKPDDINALVVTQILDDPAPAVSESITMEVDGARGTWTVVGLVRQLAGGRTGVAYASNNPSLDRTSGTTNLIRIASEPSPHLLSRVEEQLTEDGVGILSVATASDGREALDDHLVIIVGLLMIMAVLVSIVGGLGLIEAMTISVLERRRELGVMRSVGATTGAILRVVVIEGVLIAALSWLVAVALSVPATIVVETVTGETFTQAPLPLSFSWLGVGMWLVIVMALSVVGSAIPALETIESPVHQALTYE